MKAEKSKNNKPCHIQYKVKGLKNYNLYENYFLPLIYGATLTLNLMNFLNGIINLQFLELSIIILGISR